MMNPDLKDLLDACAARPASTILQRALLNAIEGPIPPEVIAYLAESDPAPHDEAHRTRIAQLLTEAGYDDAAARWSTQDIALAASAGPHEATVIRLVRATEHDRLTPPAARSQQPVITFADVGGLDSLKQQIRRKIIAPFKKPGLFKIFRKRSGGGVLMYGLPGCGKTLLARATAGEANAYFVHVAITDVLDKYFGESERKLAEVFGEARARKPAILFFDEIEALASRRRASGEIGASLVSTFLNEMDGFSGGNDGLLVLGATNTPWAIDPAFRRPGRFDRVLFVPPPDQAARLTILNLLTKDRPLAAGLDLSRFAASTAGFSGADLLNLTETAVELAIEDSSTSADFTPVSRRHFDAALAEIRPTTIEWLTTARNYAKYANESGIYDDVLSFIRQHAK